MAERVSPDRVLSGEITPKGDSDMDYINVRWGNFRLVDEFQYPNDGMYSESYMLEADDGLSAAETGFTLLRRRKGLRIKSFAFHHIQDDVRVTIRVQWDERGACPYYRFRMESTCTLNQSQRDRFIFHVARITAHLNMDVDKIHFPD